MKAALIASILATASASFADTPVNGDVLLGQFVFIDGLYDHTANIFMHQPPGGDDGLFWWNGEDGSAYTMPMKSFVTELLQSSDIATMKAGMGIPTMTSQLTNDSTFVTGSSLSSTLGSYLTTASAASTYLTPATAASTYATQSALTSGLSGKASTASTLAGYGITDSLTLAQSRAGITLTTTGSGAATYNSGTGALNVPVGGAGTVTSITAGTGLSGGTITASGTVSMPNTGTAGTYGLVTTDTQGRVTAGKRAETFSGTTNGSGVVTVTFGTAYSAAPNIQANIIGAADNQNIRITSISTTGFTVLARTRTDIVGLLPSWANASGLAVDILITEK